MAYQIDKSIKAAILAELREGAGVPYLARRYGVNETTVYEIMRRYRIKRRKWRKWTQEEDDLIREYYPTHGAAWSKWQKLMPERMPNEDDLHTRANRLGVHYNH